MLGSGIRLQVHGGQLAQGKGIPTCYNSCLQFSNPNLDIFRKAKPEPLFCRVGETEDLYSRQQPKSTVNSNTARYTAPSENMLEVMDSPPRNMCNTCKILQATLKAQLFPEVH